MCVCVSVSVPPTCKSPYKAVSETHSARLVVTSRGASLRSILRSTATPCATLRDPFLVLEGIFASHRKLTREINVNLGNVWPKVFRDSLPLLLLGERLVNFPKSPS